MAQYDIDLRDYWRIIKKRRPIIVFSMITMLVFSFFFGHYKSGKNISQYSSTSQIKIDSSQSGSDFMYNPYAATDDIDTEVTTLTTFPVMSEVSMRFGALPDSLLTYPDSIRVSMIQKDSEWLMAVNNLASLVYAERRDYTKAIDVSTTHSDPYDARDLAQHVVEVYRDLRRRESNYKIVRGIKLLRLQAKFMESSMDSINIEITKLRTSGDTDASMTPADIHSEILTFSNERDDIEYDKLSTQSMIDKLESDGLIDESAFSTTYAEEEGGIFRTQYQVLLDLSNQHDELLQYLTKKHPEVRAVKANMDAQRKGMVNQLKGNINSLTTQRENLDVRLADLRRRLNLINIRNDSMSKLDDEHNLLEGNYLNTKELLSDYERQGTETVDEVTISVPAALNMFPVNPPPSILSISFIGLFLGTVIGLTAAFIFETLDTSIGTIEDVESYLEVPVIGLIPQISADMLKTNLYNPDGGQKYSHDVDDEQAMLVIYYAPKSMLAESYRSMRTNIQFITHEQDAKVLLFTSTSPNEGKTTCIVNLALTMAQSGNRVLLIDADLRRPSIDGLFGLERENGLSEIVLGKRYWKECVNTVADIITGELGMSEIILEPGIDNLHLITSGVIPPNPSELLNNDNMDDFIATVRKEYDIVLFDCTPTLPATDPAVLGRKVDGIVFVYAVGRVSRSSLKRAKNQMDNVKANVLGVVLNGIRSDLSEDFHDYKYSQYYYYSYTDEELEAEQTKMGKIKKVVTDFVNRFV